MHLYVAVAGRKKKFQEEGTPPSPMTYFCPTLDRPLGRCGRKTLMHMQGMSTSSLTIFVNIQQAVL